MGAIDRLYKYIETKGIKPTRLEKEIGLSNGYLGTQLKRKGSLGEDVLNKIVDYCLDVSPEWLLTGRGEMLRKSEKSEQSSVKIEEELEHYKELATEYKELYQERKCQMKELQKRVSELETTIQEKDKELKKQEQTHTGV